MAGRGYNYNYNTNPYQNIPQNRYNIMNFPPPPPPPPEIINQILHNSNREGMHWGGPPIPQNPINPGVEHIVTPPPINPNPNPNIIPSYHQPPVITPKNIYTGGESDKVNSELEISRWIARRRSNFPTKENIERKQEGRSTQQQLPLSILELKLRRKIRIIRDTGREGKYKNNRRNIYKRDTTKRPKLRENEITTRPKLGEDEITTSMESKHLSHSEQNLINVPQIDITHTNYNNINATESVDPISQTQEEIITPISRARERGIKQQNRAKLISRGGESGNKGQIKDVRYKRNNLLHNLLKKEMHDECNVILQCFHYLVKENLINKD